MKRYKDERKLLHYRLALINIPRSSPERDRVFRQITMIPVSADSSFSYLIARIRRFPLHKRNRLKTWEAIKKKLELRRDLNQMEECRQRLQSYDGIKIELEDMMADEVRKLMRRPRSDCDTQFPAWFLDWVSFPIKIPDFLLSDVLRLFKKHSFSGKEKPWKKQ